jgi:excisionase family DNA binding protein
MGAPAPFTLSEVEGLIFEPPHHPWRAGRPAISCALAGNTILKVSPSLFPLLLSGFHWFLWTPSATVACETEKFAGESGNDLLIGMPMTHERWLSVDEIATHLGVNPDTVYKWIERKKLPGHKLGRLWKFKATEVDEWVRQGKAAEGAPDG